MAKGYRLFPTNNDCYDFIEFVICISLLPNADKIQLRNITMAPLSCVESFPLINFMEKTNSNTAVLNSIREI